MILQFPDLDTLRLALSGGFVPADVALAPAEVAADPGGPITVEFAGKLSRKNSADLGKLGASAVRRHAGAPKPVLCWPQAVPVEKLAAPPLLAAQAPVLFELPAGELPTFVGEMLRLGNDRQSVRWLAADDGETTDGTKPTGRVLLRVVGPPYYTLLRALDPAPSTGDMPVRAYSEQAPRVWVELGYSHPFAAQLKVPDGQAVFLRPGRDWAVAADAPFTDVYEVLSFDLPARPVDWTDAPNQEPLSIPMRLVAGNAAELPELWVLRGAAADQLDTLVRDADERLVGRLKFAVASGSGGETVVVLRTVASKLAPPVLPLAGVVGYRPYYKLPNLYVPAGARLHPTLRRDAVRTLLADDPDRLVWLAPGENGGFTPETLPEDSFRPLEDWVAYVVEANSVPLAAWVDATRFGFEPFVCSDTGGGKAPKPPGDKSDGGKKGRGRGERDDGPLTPTAGPDTGGKVPVPSAYVESAAPEVRPPSEWLIRRQALEKQFLEADGTIDAADRANLWPDLAVANAGYGDVGESAICWLNALWGHDAPPPAERDGWARTELSALAPPPAATVATLDAMLKHPEPTAAEARQFAAVAHSLAHQSPVSQAFKDRLAAVQRYLEANEPKLPVRAVWLLGSRLSELSGADTLGLARTRDRLLQRLLEEGLRPERDLPFFLRSAGLKDSDKLRQVRDQALALHGVVRKWTEASLKQTASVSQPDQGATLGYIDLFFAFSLAKLGESTQARQLAEQGRGVLTGFDPNEDRGVVGHYLAKAFTSRVEAALAGKPATGPLDAGLLNELEDIHKKASANQKQDNPFRIGHYAIARMREQSKVLEQQEKLNPYLEFMKENDELRKALNDLPRLRDPAQLARTVRELYKSGVGGRATADTRFQVLVNSLLLAGRVGEPFTVELLSLVPEVLKGVAAAPPGHADALKQQGQLLDRGLFFAAHFDRREIVQQLVDLFIDLTKSKSDEQRFDLVNEVVPQCLRSLRKMGLRDETDRLLRRLQDAVLAGQTPAKMREKYAGKPDQWGKVLRSLLTLAGGWLTFGLTGQAQPILDLARAELIGQAGLKLLPKDYTPLAQAYVAALGHGPAEEGLARVAELFTKADPARVVNTFTTSKFYSRFHLNLVEEVTLALVSDDFALGTAGRRWLEEDEYVIRRRVHRDMRRLLAAGGL